MSNDLQTMMEFMQRMQGGSMPGFRSPGAIPGLPFGGRGILIPSAPGNGGSVAPYAVPAQPKRPKLPPYADPNSI
jgi:hypothetical protein